MSKGSKLTLITHHRPHLDDICGVWLLERFWPPARNAAHDFVSSMERDPGDPERIWIGVGRSRFDEHKGDLGESAASLVFGWLVSERHDLDVLTVDALTRLVTWVRDEDMGLHDEEDYREFFPSSLLRFHYDLAAGHDSGKLLEFGMMILDNVFAAFRNTSQLDHDWKSRNDFESPWGRATALETNAYDADAYAYRQGYVLLVLINPQRKFRAFRASPHSTVDLSNAFESLKRADPKADWYLHHSRKLLICGSDVAPDSKLSKLSLQDLIRVLQPIP